MAKYDVVAMLPDGKTMKPCVVGTFDSFANAIIFKRAYEYYYYSTFDTYYDKKKVEIITRKDG